MIQRPFSITFISWFLIITASIAFVFAFITVNNPDLIGKMEQNSLPDFIEFMVLFLAPILTFTSGVLLFKGQNLGRLIYVVWTFISIIFNALTVASLDTMMPIIVIYIVVTVFLYMPKASAYFLSIDDSDEESEAS